MPSCARRVYARARQTIEQKLNLADARAVGGAEGPADEGAGRGDCGG